MTPKASVEVGGIRRSIALEAIVDTGFTGYLCVPIRVAVTLGLELIGHEYVELGDGSRKKEFIFMGSIKFLGDAQEAEILLAEGDFGLIGTRLLDDCRLTVDFPAKDVKIVRKKRAKN